MKTEDMKTIELAEKLTEILKAKNRYLYNKDHSIHKLQYDIVKELNKRHLVIQY